MLLFVFGMGARGELSPGKSYSISFADINGQKLATTDGHITIVVLTTSADREQARSVGDHVPEFCLGHPAYRMITDANFVREPLAIGTRIAIACNRHRAHKEAKRLEAC